jgi:trans-aconitate methyltransferase
MITGRPAELAAIIRTAAQMELAWKHKVPQTADERARYTPWMPFQLYEFIPLVAEAMPELNGNLALEVGCGPGTKMILMQELFHLDVIGVERNEEYAAAARSMGLNVAVADALTWHGYAGPHLVWFNRLFRDVMAEADLEAKVWAETNPGTVIMCANLEVRPPGAWYPVLDAWDDRRVGIWQKPFAGTGS